MEEARGKLEEESPSLLAGKSKPASNSKTHIVGASKRTTQSALLAGVVRKRPRTSSSEEAEKNGTTSAAAAAASKAAPLCDDDDDDSCKDKVGTGVARVIGVLPGIGEYTDSSGSDSENADETINMKHLGFMKQKKKQKKSNESQS